MAVVAIIVLVYLKLVRGNGMMSIQALTWYFCILAALLIASLATDQLIRIEVTETSIKLKKLFGKNEQIEITQISGLKTFYSKTSGMANKTGIDQVSTYETLEIMTDEGQIEIEEAVYNNYSELKQIIHQRYKK